MKIGNINIENGIFLAPMAGVTDRAFRVLCAEFGAECVTSEMISSKGVCYNDRKTTSLASLETDKRPAGLQIFGSDPLFMAKSAEKLMMYDPDFFDINMGCPVRKVVNSGDGSALMLDPRKCGEIVKAVKSAVGIPVTVKIRSGFDKNHANAVEVAKYCEEAGVDAVTVHGRTREMMYSGLSDRDIIKSVKQAVSVPVIGNGDICSGADAMAMKSYTGCDGVMIGRAAMGKPWIFKEIKAAFEGKDYELPSKSEIVSVIRRHVEMVSQIGNKEYILTMRKHIAWYTKGYPNSASVRNRLCSACEKEDFFAIIDEVFGK